MENPAGYSCVRRFCVQQLSKNTGRKISLRLVIVTGMSGAGKTTALKTLEDMGFYCADNLPVLLIEKFAELVMNGQSEKQDIALGVDVRSGEELPYLETIIRKWRENKYPFSILFLDSSDEVLIKRFKETRRSHPLSRTGRVEKGIELEREKLAFLKKEADQVIDTSRLLTKELRHELEKFKSEASLGEARQFLTAAKNVGGLKVLTAIRNGMDANALRQMGDFLRDKAPDVVAVLASANGEKITFLAVCGPEAVKRGIKAGDLVKSVCAICGGKGGGKPDSAMGGGSDLLKLDDALATVDDFVAEKLK